MNLNKMFVFIFVFMLVFAALLVTMPGEFRLLGITADVQDKEAEEFFNEADILMYNNTLTLNLTYPESKKYDFDLPSGQKLDFWWGEEYVLGYSVGAMLELRHLENELWGWWYQWHRLIVQEPYASQVQNPDWGITNAEILELFDEDYNASYCEFSCSHISVKLFITTYNQSWTLAESIANGKITLYTTYNVDWTSTGVSMWHVMMQILAFQNPDLGIPGIFGQILAAGFGGGLWACIAILVFALITSVIPTISGWRGD